MHAGPRGHSDCTAAQTPLPLVKGPRSAAPHARYPSAANARRPPGNRPLVFDTLVAGDVDGVIGIHVLFEVDLVESELVAIQAASSSHTCFPDSCR